ncbi:hypothetical protein [Streptomyces sp. NPDC048663]|uniref:hypothetical protein n=1 Tax=Streptomyces sp. NPDC048663 TaxID=3155638 RepID=UPI003426B3CF
MTSIYLSSDDPRWTPKTEADLQAAVTGGLFEESHYLDLKKAPNSKAITRNWRGICLRSQSTAEH